MASEMIGTSQHFGRKGLVEMEVDIIEVELIPSATAFWLHDEQAPVIMNGDVIGGEGAACGLAATMAQMQPDAIGIESGVFNPHSANSSELQTDLTVFKTARSDEVGGFVAKVQLRNRMRRAVDTVPTDPVVEHGGRSAIQCGVFHPELTSILSDVKAVGQLPQQCELTRHDHRVRA